MQSYTLNRPDGALLCRVLEQHTNDAAGAILRLAWMAGLMRDEIQHLTWAQVDLLGEQLLLPDRAVPLAPELAAWLEALRRERNGSSERVVLSDRDQQPLAAQSISRLARAALDAGDLKAVRLIDLRHDYVLRQLERHDWQYVSRITGLEAAAMNVHFAAYLTEKKVSTRIRRKAAPQIDEFALWKLLQAEQDTPAGAALWLTWQLGLQVEEIASLRWDQVDLQKERLILPDRQVRLTSGAQVMELFRQLHENGATIIMITHDLGVVANIADRVAVMYAGDIVEIGTSDEIYYDPRHPYTWALLSSMPQMGIKGEDLFNIQGTPPNLFTEIHGDAFAPRNPQALKIDFVKRPPYFTVSPTHKAKTWLLDPRAPKVEPPAAVKLLKEEGMQDA